jgi:hypothetical protein
MRTSTDEIDPTTGRVLNGFDYTHQAWVIDGRYVACGHPGPCTCFGKQHTGEVSLPDPRA